MSRPGAQGPALVILAGGASSRLGTCKALVDLGAGPGDTPLWRLLSAATCLNDAKPLVVSGKHHLEILRNAPKAVQVQHNRDWALGRTGSVAVAAAARPGRDLLLAPVDVPRVPECVFARLTKAWDEAGRPASGWLAPYCDRPAYPTEKWPPEGGPPRFGQSDGSAMKVVRRFGHPVLVGRELAADLAGRLGSTNGKGTGNVFLAAETWRSQPLHAWRSEAKPLLSVAVQALEILENLNTPEDLARIRTRPHGHHGD